VEQIEKRTGTWAHPVRGRRVASGRIPAHRGRPVRWRHPTRWRNPARSRISVVPPRAPLGVIPVAVAPPILMEANVGAGGRGDGGEHHRARHAGARRGQYECATSCRLAHISLSLRIEAAATRSVVVQPIPKVRGSANKSDTAKYECTVNKRGTRSRAWAS